MARLKVSTNEFIKVLERLGWELAKNKKGSSHVSYTKDGCIRPVVVILNENELSDGVITSNCRTMGITKNELRIHLGHRLPKKQAKKASS